MDRKTFLKQSIAGVAMLTVPQLPQSCKSSYIQEALDQSLKGRNLSCDEGVTPLMKALCVGISAPNPHNTQAWKFLIHDAYSCTLFVDESRCLPETDPTLRQIHIGQGCLIELFCIAAKEMGYQPKVDLLPEGIYNKEQAGKKPVAILSLQSKTDVQRDPLYAGIAQRATNRTPYEGALIEETEMKKILEDTKPQYSQIEFLNTLEGMAPVIKLIKEAIEVETYTHAKNDESRIWFRENDEQIFSKKDGISLRGSGLSGFRYWMARNFFVSTKEEDWNSKSACKQSTEMLQGLADTSKSLVWLRTQNNTLADWIQTGRDYARLHLAVTVQGLVLSPFSQILQEYQEMDQVREKLNLHLGVKGEEKIQMLVRLGRSDAHFFSPRRNLKEMQIQS